MSAPARAWIAGEFKHPEHMVEAARALREAGYLDLDTHSPFPVEGVPAAIGLPPSRVPLYTALGGASGAIGGYLLQWWCNGVNYLINVGNRPPLGPSSLWLPHFIPITFELGVLLGSFGAFFSFFALSSLPRPYHPVFQSEHFRSASVDRFWVSVALGAADDETKAADVTRILDEAGAARVIPVIPIGEPEGGLDTFEGLGT